MNKVFYWVGSDYERMLMFNDAELTLPDIATLIPPLFAFGGKRGLFLSTLSLAMTRFIYLLNSFHRR